MSSQAIADYFRSFNWTFERCNEHGCRWAATRLQNGSPVAGFGFTNLKEVWPFWAEHARTPLARAAALDVLEAGYRSGDLEKRATIEAWMRDEDEPLPPGVSDETLSMWRQAGSLISDGFVLPGDWRKRVQEVLKKEPYECLFDLPTALQKRLRAPAEYRGG